MGRIRVATWNIHGCVDRRGRYRPAEIAAVLATIDADILALQEIDARKQDPANTDVYALVAKAAGPHAAFAATIDSPAGSYGHMLLSRHPIDGEDILDLPRIDSERRKAIRARIRTIAGHVDVVATHLGFRRREQVAQMQALAATIGRPCRPTVLLGDLNERRHRGCAHRLLKHSFQSTRRHATFPSPWPVLPLDQIWFSGFRLIDSRIHRQARAFSDHLPLVAELAFAEREPAGAGSFHLRQRRRQHGAG